MTVPPASASAVSDSTPTHDPDFRLPVAEARHPLWAGVDLGGTEIKVGIVDDDGRTLAFRSEDTLVELGPEDVCRRMGTAVLELARAVGVEPSDIRGVGLGTPGPQDLPGGFIIKAGNLPGFDGFEVRDRVAHHCGRPVTFANDATAAGFGEHWIGAGRGKPSLLLLTLGTGIGGSIVLGEETLDGANSHASECGHVIVDPSPSARMCPCERSGHLEAYASAKSIVSMADEAIAAGRAPRLAEARAVAKKGRLNTKIIGQLAREGDEPSLEILDDAARWLGIGITTLLHTLDPAIVLLGGAMTFGGEQDPVGGRFLEGVRAEVRARAFPLLAERTTIRFATLGGHAGFIGAAGKARAAHRRSSPTTP